jgi:dienelactone hydrolase
VASFGLAAARQAWQRQSRWRRFAILAAGVAALIAAGLGGHTLARFQGWIVDRMTPEELATLLAPHTSVLRPEGEGPFPTALLFSGCDGPQDNMDRWARDLVAAGWAAMIVDSHTPREYLEYEKWRLVCAGQLMTGAERAGDVLVAVAQASELPFVDPDRLALIGMSHGGWSVMEMLSFRSRERLPLNLSSAPDALEERGLAGVRAVVLVYPWCGLANRARHTAWSHEAPVLFILAENDTIAPAFECRLTAQTLAEHGRTVETLTFDGVTHGFDQKHRSELSPLEYDPEATAAAIDRTINFLNEAAVATGSKTADGS